MDIATADVDTRYAIQHGCRIVERAVEALTLTGNTSPALAAQAQAAIDALAALLGSGGVELGEYPQWNYDLTLEVGVAEIQQHPNGTDGIVIRNKSML